MKKIQISEHFLLIREKVPHRCYTKHIDLEFQNPCMHDFAAIVDWAFTWFHFDTL
jgi:hypothetical protein